VATNPYTEDSEVNPLGVYGKTKWLGEQAIVSSLSQHIILRTSWVFGVHGNNFVKTILRLAAERETLTIVGDQYGCPTYAGDIANAILCIIKRYISSLPVEWGVYHCVGDGGGGETEVSWCGFSRAIVQEAYARGVISKQPEIKSIPTSAYPTPAARPAYSVLDSGKLNASFGHKMPSWRKGLTAFFDSFPMTSTSTLVPPPPSS
jgi:dTDP-4-dehydrorhamnose reductase